MLEYERTFNVNVKVCHGLGIAFFSTPQSDQLMAWQPIFCSAQVLAPFMMDQGHGVFVNTTRYVTAHKKQVGRASNQLSTGCTRPRPGFAFYNASKAAVNVSIHCAWGSAL